MARNDVINSDGSINYNTIGGFKDRLDGHDTSLAQNASDIVTNLKSKYGAVGDGNSHPLSTKYSTLAQAQAVYPHATALTDELDWCAIIAMNNDANVPTLYLNGLYRVNKTIPYKKPIIGIGGAVKLTSSINDGSAVISIDNTDSWTLSNFKVDGQNLNSIGILAANTSSFYIIDKVVVTRCKDGFNLDGWAGSVKSSMASFNTGNGWIFSNANGGDYNLIAETNGGVGVVFVSGGGSRFSLITEQNTLGGFDIQGGENVSLIDPYFESNGTFQLRIGASGSLVENVTVFGGRLVNVNPQNTTDYDIHIDMVDQVEFINTYTDLQKCVLTTANSSRVVFNGKTNRSAFIKDTGNTYRKAFNYFPNSNFDKYIAGYQGITFQHTTMVKENTLVRNGQNAIRITASDTYADASVAFILPQEVLNAVKGKSLVVGAWVYSPNTNTNPPKVQMIGAVSGTVLSSILYTTVGGWSYIHTKASPLTISSSETSLTVYFMVDSVNPAYIVVDSVTLCEQEAVDLSKMARNEYRDHPSLPRVENTNIVMYGSGIPTNITNNVNQYWEVGDKIINNAPAASGYIGWVCVANGTAGSNVGTWKGYGAIQA